MPLDFSSHPALVAYVTCGDPTLEATRDIVLAAIDAGAAVIELGVPFSDPVADGPVIQRASDRALRAGACLSDVVKLAAEVRGQRPQAGLIVFSYLNPILRLGVKRFCAAARNAGVDGALITDLPVEEADEYAREMRRCGLATVFLAAPTSTDERLRRIAHASSGFIYAVSRTGVTGARRELAGDARQLVARLRRFTTLPVAVGFGISTAEQFAQAGRFADGVVVGSAIVQLIENSDRQEAPKAVAAFVRELTEKPSAVGQPVKRRAL